MEKRKLLLAGIPITGTLAVGNLLYFWLAPDVESKLLVYGFCQGVVILQGLLSFLLWHFFGMQKATPMVVSGTAFSLGVLTAGGVMLVVDAPFRMTLYFLVIFAVLYLICAGYLSCIAADELWNRPENAVVNPPPPRTSVRSWLKTACRSFGRRRPGESYAERYVRNNAPAQPEPEPEPPQTQEGPPPLPGQYA